MGRNTETTDRHLFAQKLAELQRHAGAEREVADLVVAYGRLCADRGKPIEFYSAAGSTVPWNFALQKLLEHNPEIDARAQQFLVAYNRAMHGRRLPIIYTKEHLVARLGITQKQLHWLAYSVERYRTFYIPKANGGSRRVDEPVDKLKTVQRWILRRILEKLPVHRGVHGFRPARSILSNARNHLGSQVVVRIDLQDFFPSLTTRQAQRVFLKAGYPYTVADLLARLCSREGVLPIGAPTSPALANQICRKLDNRLWLLGREAGFHYSRYADDLVFSSSNRGFACLIPFLRQIVTEEGFRVNEKKLAIARPNSRQTVTGIVVNQKPNVRREHVKWIRAVVHNCRTGDVRPEFEKWRARMTEAGRKPPADVETFGRQLAGQVAFIRHINPERGHKLWQQFQQIAFA